MVPNDTEQTTKGILSVESGYTTKIRRYNIKSLEFLTEMKKNRPCRYCQIVWGQKLSGDFMVPNDRERTTENLYGSK